MTEDEKRTQDKRDKDEMMKFFILMLIGMTLFMGLVAVIAWEIIWYCTMDGPDPLSQTVVYAWNSLKHNGWQTLTEILATVRTSFHHVWKHGLNPNAKIEL